MKLSLGNAIPLAHDVVDLASADFAPGIHSLASLGGGEPRATQYTGIKALMLAVLEEGIRNYLGRDERVRCEAEYWIASADRRSPFAFGVVCETLGLEPGAVRVALERMRQKNVSSREAVGRSRPNVRRPGRLARLAG
jgi:hypothetical protein